MRALRAADGRFKPTLRAVEGRPAEIQLNSEQTVGHADAGETECATDDGPFNRRIPEGEATDVSNN